ncbi:MAG: 30S ribosomal protein S1 [Deltaproteobacteria bacterium]|nr:30S ribosomal protein S1 [Deltaproteobacteria bacterium]
MTDAIDPVTVVADPTPQLQEPTAGDVVRAKVVEAGADAWVLEVGAMRLKLPKTECARIAEAVVVGGEVDVFLDFERPGGPLVASQTKAGLLKVWDRLSAAAADGTPVEGKVVAIVKGGLSVDVGMRAFLPASQVDLRPAVDLRPFVDQTVSVQVVKFDRKRGNLVVSRRVLVEAERAAQKASTLKTLAEGEVVTGTVKSFVPYGAFVDIGGVDGLVHLTDLSWGHVRHPSQVLAIGAAVAVKVLKVEADKGRVALGLKQLCVDPWTQVLTKYPVGARVRAKVLRLADFGAFVELEPAVEGLLHASEMTWSKVPRHPADVVNAGDEIEVVVLDVRPTERRIALGMRQLTPNPWAELRRRYKNGDRLEGAVKSITDFGVFVEVAEGFDGLVHASDISWTEKVRPSERFKKGERVEAVVLDIDVGNERISLGIKQLTEDPWQKATARLKPGAKLSGRVTKLADFGAFVELEQGIEGLVHVSELADQRIDKPDEVVKVGETIEVMVLDVEPGSRRIALSVRALQVAAPEARGHVDSKGTRFGTALADKLAKKLGTPPKN